MLKRETKKTIIRKNSFSNESSRVQSKICDLSYLIEMMGGKSHLIIEILDAFLKQVPRELESFKEAIIKMDYVSIKNLAHTMKSSVSIMGISSIVPVLQEIEKLASNGEGLERIRELDTQLDLICKKALAEVEIEKINYE